MIRSYRPSDCETVVDIANRAWAPIKKMAREALGDKIADLNAGELGDARSKGEEVRRQIEAAPDKVLVCEENGKIVGFITYMIDEKRKIGTIGNNAADPDSGLKGIGQQMYKAVLDEFRRRGMQAVKVFTGLDHAHAPARRAYERAGFDRQLTHVTYYMEL